MPYGPAYGSSYGSGHRMSHRDHTRRYDLPWKIMNKRRSGHTWPEDPGGC
jgi:hypothetical protein